MSSILSRGGLAALPALLLLSACSDSPNSPATTAAEEQQINQDVATFVADATSDDIALMTDESDDTMDPTFANRTDCTRQARRMLRCAARSFARDLSISREITYFDVDGNEQDAFDPVTTESIHIVASLEGSRTTDRFSASISRNRDVTVSGLAGDETQRTWNGTGSTARNRTRNTDDSGLREYNMSSTSTMTDVVIPVPRTAGSFPLSGTITKEITVEIIRGLDNTKTRTRTVTIEFNGTQFVPITINGETFTLDLATHEIVSNAG
ncbi:MAG: hypothetical protein ACE5HT_10560 [Gemmatimonadales bacterium]